MRRIVQIAVCLTLAVCTAVRAGIVNMSCDRYGNGTERHSEVPSIDVSCENDLLCIGSKKNITRMEIRIMDAKGDVIYFNTVSVSPNLYMRLPKNVATEKSLIEVRFDGMILKGKFDN